jgi:polysaccharide export outer membrane protein
MRTHDRHLRRRLPIARSYVTVCLALLVTGGCYVPVCSPGIPAPMLPDSYRMPIRTAGPPLNFAGLTIAPKEDYLLGTNDVLEVTIYNLYPGTEDKPPMFQAQVMSDGHIYLPHVERVRVGGMNILQANEAIIDAYRPDVIVKPDIAVHLLQKGTTSVLVLGEVRKPGVYQLPNGENDVAHALAMAEGLREDAATEIEVHRRILPQPASSIPQGMAQVHRLPTVPEARPLQGVLCAATTTAGQADAEVGAEQISDDLFGEPGAAVVPELASDMSQLGPPPDILNPFSEEPLSADAGMGILRIPFRGTPDEPFGPGDIVLHPGDTVVVPSRKAEVFYVVGKLSPTNFLRFSISARERDIGAGFILPRDREIDVVMAVAMAGYIDPIDSPTTVTVHRILPDGDPMLIRVNLIKARYDRRETVLVQAGDIIYLNPDLPWWLRRTFDRVVGELIISGFQRAIR